MTAVLLPFFVSCEKTNEEKNSGFARLQLNVGIEGSAQLETTKGEMHDGIIFANGQTFGLCIVLQGGDTPAQPGYGNIKVTCINDSGSAWEFYNSETKTPSSTLELPVSVGAVDIYAYAPYDSTVTSPFAVPFDFTSNTDYLVADGIKNKTLTPGATNPVTLIFQHKLSLLHIGICLENPGSDHILNYIKMKTNGDPSIELFSSAVVNLSTNDTTSAKAVSGIQFDFGTDMVGDSLTYNVETVFDMLLYRTDLKERNDGDYLMEFGIDGFSHEYPVQIHDVQHDGGGEDFGFLEGYTYNFHFYISNFVRLKGITIEKGWSPGATYNYDINL